MKLFHYAVIQLKIKFYDLLQLGSLTFLVIDKIKIESSILGDSGKYS